MDRAPRRRAWALALFGVLVLAACRAPATDASDAGEAPDVTGRYSATIRYQDFRAVPGETLRSFAGDWILTLDSRAETYMIESDDFGRVSGVFQQEEDVFIFDDQPAPAGAFNCFVDGARTLTEGRSEYSAKMLSDSIELEVVVEPCPLRGAILERVWGPSS